MPETPATVAVIRLDPPSANTPGPDPLRHLLSAVEGAEADPRIRALVLIGDDTVFAISDGDSPTLSEVLARIESCTKPVVAAISGAALGAGLELALACHARVALAPARLGFPGIALGLIPGAGGTQRLPRLVGIATAWTLLHGGVPQSARQLASSGLLDQVVEADLLGAATALASTLADGGAPLPRARDRTLDADATTAFLAEQRAQLGARQRMQPAYPALLDALAGAGSPFDAGLQREHRLALELQASLPAKALRYQADAEQAASRLPDGTDAAPRPIQRVAIIGAGTMGAGIAICALDAGLQVTLLEQDDDALQRGQQRVTGHYQGRVSAGKMKAAVAADCEARLTPSTDWRLLAQADLVIEAVFEDLAVKQDVFKRIDAHARPGAVLATNTSYLDVDAIANATSRPQDVLGLHFFSPANVMKLLEVVRGAQTAPDALATGMALGQRLNKLPVLTGNAFGFIGNRIYNAYRRQCEFMLEDGAWPEEVDAALEAFGLAMGPFTVADLSGLDIAWRMRKAQAATRDPAERYVAILDHLCEQGRLGRKTGAGYYTYADGKRSKTTDDTVRATITAASAARGITRRTLSVEEIQRRALRAMADEATLLLAEGVAARPSDVDVVLVQGYGFPRWQGGPLFWARQQDDTERTLP